MVVRTVTRGGHHHILGLNMGVSGGRGGMMGNGEQE